MVQTQIICNSLSRNNLKKSNKTERRSRRVPVVHGAEFGLHGEDGGLSGVELRLENHLLNVLHPLHQHKRTPADRTRGREQIHVRM